MSDLTERPKRGPHQMSVWKWTRVGVLGLSGLVLAIPWLAPFASGSGPTYLADRGAFYETRTFSIGELSSSPSVRPPSGNLTTDLPARICSIDYGAVEFSFECAVAYPTVVWVKEEYGGNYGSAMPNNGTWMSPDGLSGVRYFGGQHVTLLATISGVIYGLPALWGWIVFLLSLIFVACASWFYRSKWQFGARKPRDKEG